MPIGLSTPATPFYNQAFRLKQRQDSAIASGSWWNRSICLGIMPRFYLEPRPISSLLLLVRLKFLRFPYTLHPFAARIGATSFSHSAAFVPVVFAVVVGSAHHEDDVEKFEQIQSKLAPKEN
ncbi:hypothetical protein V8G54_031051 [Vigna mungo]|uniref:Uncharacterized protein n=1 Tax=Vigna mungo TaxID=3915 RepID=A0AAQ3MXF1_VIGMU